MNPGPAQNGFAWQYPSLLGLALTILGAVSLVSFWPPSFGPVFWAGLWAVVGGLLLMFGSMSLGLIRAAPIWAKLAGTAAGLVALALLAALAFVAFRYLQMGASLEQLETAESHGQPGGRTVRLTYLRLRSTSAEPGPPVVYLAGGPGGSGVLTAISSRFPLFGAMREIGDVIALDQRGTIMPWNDPWLVCPSTWDYPLDQPLLRERAVELRKEYVRDCAAYFEASGVALDAYTTVQNAKDLEVLRKQLGSEKISLWATSYGTHLALAYLRRHSDRVHRVILQGVEGPDHTLKLPSNVERALLDVSALAAASPDVARVVPDLHAAVADALDRLEAEPQRIELDEGSVVLGKFDLQLLTSLLLGSASNRMSLPSLYADLARGDYTRVARFALSSRRGNRASLMSLLMDCASGASPERIEQIRSEADATLLGDAINYPFPEVCEFVPIGQLGPEFRAPVVSTVPALFISGTMDGRTPVSNAEEVRRGFPNSEHLILEGAGHSDELFLASPMILEVMLQFMRGEPVAADRVEIPREFEPVKEPSRSKLAPPGSARSTE